MPFLIELVAGWGVPERFQRLAAIGTAIVAFLALCGLVAGAWALIVHRHDKTVIQADRNAANVQAVTTARKADESAQTAAQGKTDEVQHANDNARKAASDSDDPLAAGLHSLRHDSPR